VQFSYIQGQEELKHHLIQEVNGGKISHAQLFVGQAGYGTLPLAQAFVQYLFCENKSATDSCGECVSCKKVSTAQHPDVHYVFPTVQAISKTSNGMMKEWRQQLAEQPLFDLHDWLQRIDDKERKPIIGTEESLEIIKKLALKSYEGGYKVMFIWMADEMNTICANKILKILEEPPEKTLFILIASSTDKLLATILSRAQLIRVPRFTLDNMQVALQKEGLNNQQAASVAARAEGDLLAAMKLLGHQEEVDLNRELFIQLMRVCFKKDVNAMLDWTDAVAGLTKEGQKLFTLYALHMIRQSVLTNYTQDMLARVSSEEAAFLTKFSRFISNNNMIDFMEIFNDAHYHLERNAFSKLLFTQVCFQVMRFIHKA
jgi:DNA polymerase-3 subunit delta'